MPMGASPTLAVGMPPDANTAVPNEKPAASNRCGRGSSIRAVMVVRAIAATSFAVDHDRPSRPEQRRSVQRRLPVGEDRRR